MDSKTVHNANLDSVGDFGARPEIHLDEERVRFSIILPKQLSFRAVRAPSRLRGGGCRIRERKRRLIGGI